MVLVPTFVSSEETREIKEYYPSGKIRVIAIYKGNKREGRYRTYYESGTIQSQGTYKNDKLDGTFTTYSIDRRVEVKWNF
ncbi:MAG TPA: hypothetical protein VN843_25020, partial [Anaerolineales bacterium]|nr:hypothetical protein [Anaerolineales bacterium]